MSANNAGVNAEMAVGAKSAQPGISSVAGAAHGDGAVLGAVDGHRRGQPDLSSGQPRGLKRDSDRPGYLLNGGRACTVGGLAATGLTRSTNPFGCARTGLTIILLALTLTEIPYTKDFTVIKRRDVIANRFAAAPCPRALREFAVPR